MRCRPRGPPCPVAQGQHRRLDEALETVTGVTVGPNETSYRTCHVRQGPVPEPAQSLRGYGVRGGGGDRPGADHAPLPARSAGLLTIGGRVDRGVQELLQPRHSVRPGAQVPEEAELEKVASSFPELLRRHGDTVDDGAADRLVQLACGCRVRASTGSEGERSRTRGWSLRNHEAAAGSARLGLISSSGHFVEDHDPKPFGVESMAQEEATSRTLEFYAPCRSSPSSVRHADELASGVPRWLRRQGSAERTQQRALDPLETAASATVVELLAVCRFANWR